MIETIGIIATTIALGGVWLNNRKRRACFLLWLVSNGLTAAIHVHAGIWSLAVRDVLFFALAVEGLILWRVRK